MAQYYKGTSAQTRKGLIDSGAMDKSDFQAEPNATPAKSVIPKDSTRQVDQSEYNRMLSAEKAKAEANYQRYKNTAKNLGKYLHKAKKP
jgi:hypothetical protein